MSGGLRRRRAVREVEFEEREVAQPCEPELLEQVPRIVPVEDTEVVSAPLEPPPSLPRHPVHTKLVIRRGNELNLRLFRLPPQQVNQQAGAVEIESLSE